MLNIPDIHRRLTHDMPLTIDETRELYDLLYYLACRTDSHSFEVRWLVEAGKLPPRRKRCKSCDGEGKTFVANKPRLAPNERWIEVDNLQQTCPDCQGTGYAK